MHQLNVTYLCAILSDIKTKKNNHFKTLNISALGMIYYWYGIINEFWRLIFSLTLRLWMKLRLKFPCFDHDDFMTWEAFSNTCIFLLSWTSLNKSRVAMGFRWRHCDRLIYCHHHDLTSYKHVHRYCISYFNEKKIWLILPLPGKINETKLVHVCVLGQLSRRNYSKVYKQTLYNGWPCNCGC